MTALILAVAVGYRQVKSQDTQDGLDDDGLGYDTTHITPPFTAGLE